ncbi:MAG: serine hydrolase domain-containing protein [Bacteroidota bacterium]
MLKKGAIIVLTIIVTSLLFDATPPQSQAGILTAIEEDPHKLGTYLRIMKAPAIDTIFSHLHHKRRFNGSVLVLQEGETLYKKSFGYANLRTKENLDEHSAFQLASVSKIFTAFAVILLQQEGKLTIEDKVADHIKGWPYKNMSIKNLLNHRSGMSRYMAVASWYWKSWRKDMSNDDVLKQFIRHKPPTFFRPDRNFNYCNTNYVILASLVEEVSGMPFEEFMQERIFNPLEMKDAMIFGRGQGMQIPHEAEGYKAGRRGYYVAPNDYIDGVWGDKNMFASVSDLEKFDKALRENKLLDQKHTEMLFEPGSKWRKYNYGLGWRLKRGEENLIYHFGWWRGYRTCYIKDPTNDLTLIILTNRDHPGLNVDYWKVYKQILDT